jgi:hypothetical protein
VLCAVPAGCYCAWPQWPRRLPPTERACDRFRSPPKQACTRMQQLSANLQATLLSAASSVLTFRTAKPPRRHCVHSSRSCPTAWSRPELHRHGFLLTLTESWRLNRPAQLPTDRRDFSGLDSGNQVDTPLLVRPEQTADWVLTMGDLIWNTNPTEQGNTGSK